MRQRLGLTLLLAALFLSFWMADVLSAQPVITASVPADELKPHDLFNIDFLLNEPLNVYYFSVSIVVDPAVLDFQGVNESESMGNSIHIADSLTPGEIGASITRTDQSDIEVSGNLLSLSFRVVENSAIGDTQVEFNNIELSNSDGTEIQTEVFESETLVIESGISRLEFPADTSYSITAGDPLALSGKIYINGLTDEMDESDDRVSVWAGLNSEDSDPAGWSESAWQELTFSNADSDGYHHYFNTITYEESSGNYFLALRARINGGPFRYGGINESTNAPFWNGLSHSSATLEVLDAPNFRYDVIAWSFDNNSMLATSALPQNSGKELHLVGANQGSFSTGKEGLAANATGWDEPESETKYWLANFSTTDIQNIQVSSSQYSSGSGPSVMNLEGSLDGVTWQPIDQGAIDIQSDWSSGELTNLPLDVQYENKEDVYLRWIATEDSRVSDGSGISAQGTSRIDNISITGENISPQEMTIWPGDTDSNSQVNEADVLPLGLYWLASGPKPLFNTTTWVSRTTEGWIPAEATAADADGNGKVDHRDIKVIGLNFGNTHSNIERSLNSEIPVTYNIPVMKKGEHRFIAINLKNPLFIQGVAYQIELRGVPADYYRIDRPMPGPWSEEWVESGNLLSFQRNNSGTGSYSGAYVHKGWIIENRANRLLTIKVTAEKTWKQNAQLLLNRLTISNRQESMNIVNRVTFENVTHSSEGEDYHEDEKISLVRVFPNPVDTESTIGYWMKERMFVSIEIYDLMGRFVQSLKNDIEYPGYNEINFNTNNLASGLYIILLKGGGRVLTHNMMVIH